MGVGIEVLVDGVLADGCEHQEHEDHLACVGCGYCREDLDADDKCVPCGGRKDDQRLGLIQFRGGV